MSKFLEQLSPEEAKTVLRLLSKENREWAQRIEELAEAQIRVADEDKVASDVYRALIDIDIDDLWDRPSGSERFRYAEPAVAAYEMVEEALEPFAEQLKRYRNLAMFADAKKMGRGLAKGILKFSSEGQTEFKEYAPYDASEWLDGLLTDWQNECRNANEKECICAITELLEE